MNRSACWAALLAGLASFIAYACTTPAGLSLPRQVPDSSELTLVGLHLGVAHPTGYPLYALWLRLAIALGSCLGGEPPHAAHLLSALIAGVTVGLLACLLIGWLNEVGAARHSLLCGVTAALMFAASPAFWAQATVCGVYPLHLAITVLLLILATTYRGSTARLVLLGYVAGLGFSHHVTTVLILPALLALLARNPRPDRRALLLVGLAFVAPLTLYAVLPVRARFHPSANWSDPETVDGIWRHVSGRDLWDLVHTASARPAWAALRSAMRDSFARQGLLLVLATIPAMAGALVFARRAGIFIASLGLLVLAHLAWAAVFPLPSRDVVLLPALLAWAGFTAFGLVVLRRILSRLQAAEAAAAPRGWKFHLGVRRAALVLSLVIGSCLLYTGLISQHLEESRDSLTQAHRAREAIVLMPPHAVVVSDQQQFGYALEYERWQLNRMDVAVICAPLLQWSWYLDALRRDRPELSPPDSARSASSRLEAIIASAVRQRPVFSTYADDWITRRFATRPSGAFFVIDGGRQHASNTPGPYWESLPVDWGEAATSDVFIHLGGAALPGEPVEWGDVVFRLEHAPVNIVRGLSFASGTGRAPVRLQLAARPTRGVCLIVGGRNLARGGAPLMWVRIMAGADTLASEPLIAYRNVWDPDAVRGGLSIPDDVRLVRDSCFSVFCVPLFTPRVPDGLLIEAPIVEWPPGVQGQGPGVVVLAVTQVAHRVAE